MKRNSKAHKTTDQELIREIEEEVHSSVESSPENSPSNNQRENVGNSPREHTLHSKVNNDDLQLRKDAYERVRKVFPPLPILPKSVLVHDDSPRSGGE